MTIPGIPGIPGKTTPEALAVVARMTLSDAEHTPWPLDLVKPSWFSEMPNGQPAHVQRNMQRAPVLAQAYLDAAAENERLRQNSQNDWRQGVLDAIKIIEQRQQHYELYRKCDTMRMHPAVYATLDEIHVFLQAMLERGTYTSTSDLMKTK